VVCSAAMRIDAISIGETPPDDINVIIEVPVGGAPIKYEMDKASGTLFVDRFLYTAMVYPGNYGFVPHTLSNDGDPIDVLVCNTRAIVPGAVMSCRPVGVLVMEDDNGEDEKIIAVPTSKEVGQDRALGRCGRRQSDDSRRDCTLRIVGLGRTVNYTRLPRWSTREIWGIDEARSLSCAVAGRPGRVVPLNRPKRRATTLCRRGCFKTPSSPAATHL